MSFEKGTIREVQNVSKELDKKYYGKVVKDVDIIYNSLYKNFEDSIIYALAYIYAIYIESDIENRKELYFQYLKDEISLYEMVGLKALFWSFQR